MSNLVAIFDANVIYPAPLRDLLMGFAVAGLFRARWTDEIHREWIGNLLANEPHRERVKLERTRELMNKAVLDCLITGYEEIIETLTLPDSDDRHVLAAAICGRADVIVTFNLKDFPKPVLDTFEIEAIHPDDFICHLLDFEPSQVCDALKAQRERLKNPPKSAEEFLAMIEKQNLPQTSERLKTMLDQF